MKNSMRQFMEKLSVEAYDLQVIKPQADEALSSMLSSSQWGLGPVCQSPGPWGAEQQPSVGGGLPASSNAKRSGLGQVR